MGKRKARRWRLVAYNERRDSFRRLEHADELRDDERLVSEEWMLDYLTDAVVRALVERHARKTAPLN